MDDQLLLAAGDTLAGQITGQTEGLPSPVARATIRENVNFNDLDQAIRGGVRIRESGRGYLQIRTDPPKRLGPLYVPAAVRK